MLVQSFHPFSVSPLSRNYWDTTAQKPSTSGLQRDGSTAQFVNGANVILFGAIAPSIFCSTERNGELTANNTRTRVGDRVTIYPRGKKRIYCADFSHEGKHHRISLETRNKKVATQRAVKIDAELSSGKYSPPPPLTRIDQAIRRYIAYLKSEGRARKTIVRYQGELDVFCEFCSENNARRLDQVTMLLFDGYRANRREVHAERTVFHESVVVKQFMKWCRLRKLVGNNPLQDYRLEKPKHTPKGGPSLKQVNQILDSATLRKIQFATLAFAGMRSGELQRLQRVDVDLAHNWIHIVSRPEAETKTRESWKVPIHERLRHLLETMPVTSHNWFYTAGPSKRFPNGGNWVNPKRLNDDLLSILQSLEIPAGRKEGGFTVHSFRHFFKTHCINCGVPKPVVDIWQGHKIDLSVGAQYYKLSDEESQRFMRMVSFDAGKSAADADDQ